MAAQKRLEHLFPDWLKLVRDGMKPSEAARSVGASKWACQRWVKEMGISRKEPLRPKPIPHRPPRKDHVLNRLFSSPLGGYPGFLEDYRKAAI